MCAKVIRGSHVRAMILVSLLTVATCLRKVAVSSESTTEIPLVPEVGWPGIQVGGHQSTYVNLQQVGHVCWSCLLDLETSLFVAGQWFWAIPSLQLFWRVTPVLDPFGWLHSPIFDGEHLRFLCQNPYLDQVYEQTRGEERGRFPERRPTGAVVKTGMKTVWLNWKVGSNGYLGGAVDVTNECKLWGCKPHKLGCNPHISTYSWSCTFKYGSKPCINGHFKILDWRYLPYIRPFFKG